MKRMIAATIAVCLAGGAMAEDKHQHEAHVHGMGALDIAVEGKTILMELRAPGADIVGFEHAAHDEDDKSAISVALQLLSEPAEMILANDEAECDVVSASATLEGGAEGDDQEAHEEENGTHSEFHAEYVLECAHLDGLETIELRYFDAFERAEALEVRLISDKGSFAEELSREARVLKLQGRL